MEQTILKLNNVVSQFSIRGQMVPAVRSVSLEVKKGKTLVILGESGSGKSVMLRSILRILPRNTKTMGSIEYNGEDLLQKSEKEMRHIRGNRIAMVFQDSLSALDALYKVGHQVGETITNHAKTPKEAVKQKVIELFNKVGIPSPQTRVKAYPFEMSGGMRQRSVIAMSLACAPDLLLADEPTTALDVTIQAQILSLFKQIQQEYGMTVILVTHDIGVAIEMADEIAVMYAGKIVESGTVEQVLGNPQHPYTKGLIAATPTGVKTERLHAIAGQPPALIDMPAGCAFAGRCSEKMSCCTSTEPGVVTVDDNHQVACHLMSESI